MARVNRPKKKAAHAFLIAQEQKIVTLGKDRKSLAPAASPVTSGKDVKMAKDAGERRETRREKVARKKLETKRRKAPQEISRKNRMDLDEPGRLPVKKSGGIHKK